MFSGIVEQTGIVMAVRSQGPGAARIVVDANGLFTGLSSGASVAINGVCLTLVSSAISTGEFDIVPETLRRTNLGALRTGSRVNLERALRVGDRIDGHLVQGHVDLTGRVERIDRTAGEWKLWVEASEESMPFIVPKGSITLDGVSLTIVDVEHRFFSVALIPTTLERTTLAGLRPGDSINIETDILARVAVRRIDALFAALAGSSPAAPHRGVSLEQLQSAGFCP